MSYLRLQIIARASKVWMTHTLQVGVSSSDSADTTLSDLVNAQSDLIDEVVVVVLRYIRALALTSLASSRMEARLTTFRSCCKIIVNCSIVEPNLLNLAFQYCSLQTSPSRWFISLLRVCPPSDEITQFVALILLKLHKTEKRVERIVRAEKAVQRILQMLSGAAIDRKIKIKTALIDLLTVYCHRNESGRSSCCKAKGLWRLLIGKNSPVHNGMYVIATAKLLQLLIRKSSKFSYRLANTSAKLQNDVEATSFSKPKGRGFPELLLGLIKHYKNDASTLQSLLSLGVAFASYPFNAQLMHALGYSECVIEHTFRRSLSEAEVSGVAEGVWGDLVCINRTLELISLTQRQNVAARFPPLFPHNEWAIPTGHPDDVVCEEAEYLERFFPELFMRSPIEGTKQSLSTSLLKNQLVAFELDGDSDSSSECDTTVVPLGTAVASTSNTNPVAFRQTLHHPSSNMVNSVVASTGANPLHKDYLTRVEMVGNNNLSHRGKGCRTMTSINGVSVTSLRPISVVMPDSFSGTVADHLTEPMPTSPAHELKEIEFKAKQNLLRKIVDCSRARSLSLPPCRVVFALGKPCAPNLYSSGNQPQPAWCSADSPVLQFNCAFESGNLCTVVQTGQREYELSVWRDFNTTSHSQV